MGMNLAKIDQDKLFDVEAYWRSGGMPWTIFAYPSKLADAQGWPPDQEAIDLFALLQERGLQIGVWKANIGNDTFYFAVPKEDIQRSGAIIQELEARAIIKPDFLNQHCEELFSQSYHELKLEVL